MESKGPEVLFFVNPMGLKNKQTIDIPAARICFFLRVFLFATELFHPYLESNKNLW